MSTPGSALRTAPRRPHPVGLLPLPDHVRIAIVGAGFSGIGAAIALSHEGYGDELILLERRADVGGTWYDNSYPGCRCDVPSNLYSFSFAPNPHWSETYSSQPEIERYLQATARQHGVTEKVAFETTLDRATWDATGQVWRIETSRGSLTADFLIGGGGGLSEPHIPDIPGAVGFSGTTFHSARWDHTHDLTGRRVAIIGTGASTIQFLPFVQKSAGHVTLFQRTPPWVFPHPNRKTRASERVAYKRWPWTQRAARARTYWIAEATVGSLLIHNKGSRRLSGLAEKFMTRQVADPALRAKLTPTYAPGCKRLLQSNDYFPALQRPNVTLETEKIIELRPEGVVTADGAVHDVDTIIYGTGFRVTSNPMAAKIHGVDGRSLKEHWADSGMQAYCGTTIPGFPNYFMLAGPNTGIGHTSLVVMIEAQVAHVVAAFRTLQTQGARVVELRSDTLARWSAHVGRKARSTVWNSGGCSSWYLDEEGRNTTLWPDYAFRFVRRARSFAASDYVLSGPRLAR